MLHAKEHHYPTLLAIPLLLVLFSVIIFLFRKSSKRRINLILIFLAASVLPLNVLFIKDGLAHSFFQTFAWFEPGQKIIVSVGLDSQGGLMLGLVMFTTLLVIFYSVSYMKDDKDYGRYFSSLLLFAAAMSGVVLSFNLLFTFIFWELVGFSSYLLINHWYEKAGTSDAAGKAFITNRIGDMGFVLGLGLLYAEFGTFEISVIENMLRSGQVDSEVLFWAGLGIFFGCIGKSAQFPLFVWLPDAMKAPTPVSALLHAATMVAAGVFLLARIFPLLHPDLLTYIAYTGAVTSFIGAFSAATQTDIKKILAYSTISQLGYMMAALGAHSYIAPMFHLFTHAIFKASLFLCAGAIIHAMSHLKEHIKTQSAGIDFDPQDIRLMGGLRKRMPLTFLAFAMASMAGAGIPFSSGFLSKDEILAAVTSWSFAQNSLLAYLLPVLIYSTSLMTAFYLGRMFFLIFFGGFRLGKVHPHLIGLSKHIHEAPFIMLITYVILSVMCFFIFFSTNPFDPDQSWILQFLVHPVSVFRGESSFLLKLNEIRDFIHYRIIAVSISILTLGFGLSYFFYGFKTKFKKDFLKLHISLTVPAKLSINALYIDKLYQKIFITKFYQLASHIALFEQKAINSLTDNIGVFIVTMANLISWFDKVIVDGTVNFIIFSLNSISYQLRLIQNGKVQSYLVGAVLVFLSAVIWIML